MQRGHLIIDDFACILKAKSLIKRPATYSGRALEKEASIYSTLKDPSQDARCSILPSTKLVSMRRISSDSALKSALYLQQRLSLAVTGAVMKRSDSRERSALRSLGYPYSNSLVTTIQS